MCIVCIIKSFSQKITNLQTQIELKFEKWDARKGQLKFQKGIFLIRLSEIMIRIKKL